MSTATAAVKSIVPLSTSRIVRGCFFQTPSQNSDRSQKIRADSITLKDAMPPPVFPPTIADDQKSSGDSLRRELFISSF
jgi:hypothetical protein